MKWIVRTGAAYLTLCQHVVWRTPWKLEDYVLWLQVHSGDVEGRRLLARWARLCAAYNYKVLGPNNPTPVVPTCFCK